MTFSINSIPDKLEPDEWDNHFRKAINGNFIGVDEAGRGPLAGPVAAAAVILPDNHGIKGLRDSKKIAEKERELLEVEIIKKALLYRVEFIEHDEIDRINILNAALTAMGAAVSGLDSMNVVVVDGNKRIPSINNEQFALVKGDSKSASVAAASILAKVARDRRMAELHQKYPQYEFNKHKGYPTKLHYERLGEYGPSPVHRLTFKGVIQ